MWNNLTNDEILLKLKEIQIQHENKKQLIIGLLNELDELDETFKSGNKELENRINGK